MILPPTEEVRPITIATKGPRAMYAPVPTEANTPRPRASSTLLIFSTVASSLTYFSLKAKAIKNTAKAGAVSSPLEEPVDDERIYKVVTIDYLLKEEIGGDVMAQADKMQNCNMPLGNTLVQHIKKLAKKGEVISL